MDNEQILGMFEELAEKLSIEVRHDPNYKGTGGLCTIRGKKVFILNSRLSPEEKVDLFIREFKKIPFDGVYLVPKLRDLMEDRT
jgi:hypothetical protein